MRPDRDEINDAIYSAVGDGQLSNFAGGKAVPGVRAVSNFKSRIKKFLHEIPSEFTVAEILEAMERRDENF